MTWAKRASDVWTDRSGRFDLIRSAATCDYVCVDWERGRSRRFPDALRALEWAKDQHQTERERT